MNTTSVKIDHYFNKYESGIYVLNGTGKIQMGGWNCKLKKPISLDIKATLDMGLNTADTLSNIVDDLSTNSSMADVIIHDLEVATGVVVDGVNTWLPFIRSLPVGPPGGPIHKNQFFSVLDGVFTIFLNGNVKNYWRFAQKTHFIDIFCIYGGP